MKATAASLKIIDNCPSLRNDSVAMIFHVARAGQLLGEFSREDFMYRIKHGFVRSDDDFWAEGMSEWRKVADYYAPAAFHRSSGAGAQRGTSPVVLGLGALFLVLIFAGVISQVSDGINPKKTSKGKPDARVAADRLSLRVTNSGSEGWEELIVYLNGIPPFTYKWQGFAPPVGKTIAIPLNEFSKKDGERFDPLRLRVTEAWVGGDGYDYGQAVFR